ncbi:unnamed protein product [Miscanthus lutarioriparius]|uniref:Rx N-terminal domain-containing protein n=1 Tax=Miscanthus lutarioriparius TaxID=422564 RepID=A0A811MMZ3_9POAL|nr:unnamed protein product [Miscanthus lutarioriparius]
MESAIAAVAGELVSRFISFAFNRYCSSSSSSSSYEDEGLEERRERLRHLLTRVHTVIEEADARYISNSGMLMQLKMLSEAMYQGYHALDTLTFQLQHEVSDSSISLCSATRLKRPRTVLASAKKDKVHAALENLETAVANISEFVVLLCGCDERLSCRPYDAYLYIGNFMFGRHAEKQKLLNFLLQPNPSDDRAPPPVLPIIGALAVGKKTLVAHVCADERVRSKFASILHLNGDNFLTIVDHEKALVGMSSLVVVELVSDVDDVKWNEFYSFVTRATSTRSKVIIISKLGRLARFGSVRPIFLDGLSYEEFWYLFKNLAFGSADPAEHPRLVHIAEGFAEELHQSGSLVTANALADVLRSNLNAQFWLSILNKCRKVIEKNLIAYGQLPNLLFEQGREVDLTDFVSSPVINPLRVLPCTSSALAKTELPKAAFGELLLDPSVRPKGEFRLLTWESRLPPHTSFIHFVPNCTQDMPQGHSLSGRKRHTVPF